MICSNHTPKILLSLVLLLVSSLAYTQDDCPISISSPNDNTVYCANDLTPISLSGNATDGIFYISGQVISEASFIPETLGLGLHTIIYEGSELTDGTICSGLSSTSIIIEIIPGPDPTFATGYDIVCIGSFNSNFAFVGNASSDATFEWDFDEGANPPTANGIGPHEIEWDTSGTKNISLIIHDNGCTAEANSTVYVYPPLEAPIISCIEVIDENSVSVGWEGGNAILGASVDFVLGPENNSIILDLNQGESTEVTATTFGIGNCINAETSIIINNPLPPTIIGSTEICGEESIQIAASENYDYMNWYDEDNNLLSTESYLETNQIGTYYLTAYNENDCASTQTIEVTSISTPTWYEDSDGDGLGNPDSSIEDCTPPAGYVSNSDDIDDSVYIETINHQLSIYPNPAQSQFTIEWDGSESIHNIQIQSIDGSIIKTIAWNNNAAKQSFDSADLANGLYMISIQTDNYTFNKKLEIQH